MADDSDQQSPPDPHGLSPTRSGEAAQSTAEQDGSKQDAAEESSGSGKSRRRGRIAWDEFWDLFFGKQDRHRRLHGRLIGILLVSLLVNGLVALALTYRWVDPFSKESGPYFWRALAWTSSQMVVGGSSYDAQTGRGHVLEVFLQGYGVIVIGAIAGAFASYFLSGDKT